MKKLIACFLCGCLLLSFSACGQSAPKAEGAASGESSSALVTASPSPAESSEKESPSPSPAKEKESPKPSPTAKPTATPTPEPTVKPTVEPTPKPTAKPTPKPTKKPKPTPEPEPPGRTPASEIQEKYPVQGGAPWKFFTTDSSKQISFFDPPRKNALSSFTFEIAEDDSTKITHSTYLPPEDLDYTPEEKDLITWKGKQYAWVASSYFEGNCSPNYDGSVTITLRCYDTHGNFLSDDLHFDRIDANTMRLKSNSGTALPLTPKDTFTRN